MAILKKIILSVLILGTLSSCSQAKELPTIKGALLPHHLFVEIYMDKLYKEISSNNSYDRIIIISPNHFGFGFQYIQSTDKYLKKAPKNSLDIETITKLENQKQVNIKPEYFHEEHGITTHFNLINKYFPKAKIVPIIIKEDTPKEKLDELITGISQLDLNRTLIIASIDFTHYTLEEYAIQNDANTVEWLNQKHSEQADTEIYEELKNLSKSINTEYDGIAMDSPETLYVLLRVMQNQKSDTFQFYERTSSSSLSGTYDPLQNTSHIFGWFEIQ